VGFAQAVIAYQACLTGLSKLAADEAHMFAELDANWEILAEPIQTVMRRYGLTAPYEKLKTLTRGQQVDATTLQAFIESLELPAQTKQRLLALTPADYTGNAAKQARRISCD
jgi:adenylosuccinate lyase